MNFINKICLFRHLNVSAKFPLKLPNTDLKKVHFKNLNLNTKMKYSLILNDKIISNHESRNFLSRKLVGYWLLTCSGMVFVAVTLGGLTRLTESGLSMVTWKLFGERMPFNELSWLDEFEKYKKYPEYKLINKDITLDEFKQIWFMEYVHRMWGRLIGIVFIVPASYFWMKGLLKPGMKKKILILSTLIGCQGLLGWYMVKSGLENEFSNSSEVPRVSQYRLAAHLGLAIILYSAFLYNALDHLFHNQNINIDFFQSKLIDKKFKILKQFKSLAISIKGLVFLTAISGAFVAGLDAGLIYNTFPKMSDKWIPDDILILSPILKNFTENPTTVQFDHRILALITLFVVTYMGVISRKYKLPKRVSIAILSVLSTAYLQVALGILTLCNLVPTHFAIFHQSGSLIFLSTITWLYHELKWLKKVPK